MGSVANGVVSVFKGEQHDGLSVIVSYWKMTEEELLKVNKTGRVWIVVLGGMMVPAMLDGTSPFERKSM